MIFLKNLQVELFRIEEGIYLVLSLQLILQLYVLFSLGQGISLRILFTRVVYNYKKELGEYFSPLGLLTSKLLYYYKILKSFIIYIDLNLRVMLLSFVRHQDNNYTIASISLLCTLQLHLARAIIFKKNIIGYHLPSRYSYKRTLTTTLLDISVSSINSRSRLQ